MRILISYWYFKDTDVGAMIRKLQDLAGVEKMDVFADSGAFTAQSSGVHIDLAEYTDWIHKWEEYLTVYLNLDVIGDQDGTNRNQERLENEFGVHPVPVFTFQRHGSDYDTLARQLDRYEYISLGGMVPFMGRPKQVMPHLIKCFKMAGDRAVFHGLGCTNWTIMKSLPFYSVDSSSWVGGVRYGNLAIFDERRGTWRRCQLGKPRSFLGLAGLFAQYGYDVNEFVHRHTQQYHDIAAIQALSYMAAERWLRRRHGLVFFPSHLQGIVKDCLAVDPRHPQIIQEAGGKIYITSAPNLLEDGAKAVGKYEGVRSYLATVPWMDDSMDAIGDKVKSVNDESGPKTYIATSAGELFDRPAEQLGRLAESGHKTYIAHNRHTEASHFYDAARAVGGLKMYLAERGSHFEAVASGLGGLKLYLADTDAGIRFEASARQMLNLNSARKGGLPIS